MEWFNNVRNKVRGYEKLGNEPTKKKHEAQDTQQWRIARKESHPFVMRWVDRIKDKLRGYQEVGEETPLLGKLEDKGWREKTEGVQAKRPGEWAKLRREDYPSAKGWGRQ